MAQIDQCTTNKRSQLLLNHLTHLHKLDLGKDLIFKFRDGELLLDQALMAAMSPFMQQLLQEISGEVDSVICVIIEGSLEAGRKMIELLYTGKTQIPGSLLDELTHLTKILKISSMSVDVQVVDNERETEGALQKNFIEGVDDCQLIEDASSFTAKSQVEKDCTQEQLGINNHKLRIDKKPKIKSNKKEETKLSDSVIKKLSKRAVLNKEGNISWANNKRGKTDGIIKPCYICPKSYIQYFDFTKHLREHSLEKGPFPCPQCQELCENGLKLHAHIQKLHVSHQTFGVSEDGTKIICKFPFCKQEFIDIESCDHHIALEHKNLKKKVYMCRLEPCNGDQIFTTLPSFRSHTLEVHKLKPLACSEESNGCVFRASDWQKLDDHIQGVHKDKHSLNIPCDVCGKKFTNQTYLMSHRRRMHETNSNDRGKICPYCGERKLQLMDHINRAHRDFRFSCDYCPKKFKTSVQKRLHHNTHTGFRPYTCDSCKCTFARLHHRKTHLEKTGHEPGPVLKPEGHVDGRTIPKLTGGKGGMHKQEIIKSLKNSDINFKIQNLDTNNDCQQIIQRLYLNQQGSSQIEAPPFLANSCQSQRENLFQSTASSENINEVSYNSLDKVDINVDSTDLNSGIEVNTF